MKAITLIEEIASKLPRELEDVRRQILRSARAICPIIAEGYGRKSFQRELRRYVIEAMSSSDETITHLRTITYSKFNTISPEELNRAVEEYKSISRQLNKFTSSIRI